MNRTGFIKSSQKLLYSFSCLSIVAITLLFITSHNTVKAGSEKARLGNSTTFSGNGVGSIPDGTGSCGLPSPTNLDITFQVSGVTNFNDVSIDMTATHSWAGDVSATLIAPTGETHILFKNTGWFSETDSCGSGSALDGIYNFTDSATGPNWWTVAESNSVVTSGDYRTTEPGSSSQIFPAPVTSINSAFTGITDPNGNWVLRVNDSAGQDTGTISVANLTFTGDPGGPVANGNPDFDGDGKTDFGTIRDETPANFSSQRKKLNRRSIKELQKAPGFKVPSTRVNNAVPSNHGTDLVWYINNSQSSTVRIQGQGQPSTDFYVPGDYDGDGMDDLAVWRGVGTVGPLAGFYYTFTSSNNTVNETDFGLLGDNPTLSGDYDGDGIDDPAVFRCPSVSPGQCFFYYLGSNNNPSGNITYTPWGFGIVDPVNPENSTIRPYPGDFDGDGSNDFCVYTDGLYTLLRSSDFGVEYIRWGNPNEPVLAPGDYDGDGSTDFMNVRINGTDVEWWLLERDGAQSTTKWGTVAGSPSFDEFITPGDYDGDGSTDIGVWRRDNLNDSNSFFYILRSSDSMLQAFQWGASKDAPIPGWNTN